MESQDGISVRPMRLKVLYTFDNESKTNCLARWPHLLDVQTAHLDEKTQIGVIELKTCIQSIVSASPELVAKLGQDYTVYAYDYSEYETPLVGQGMLSWVLASSSPTPNAPAHHSKTMVTGRVSKNVLGLFSKGAQETLEVKLRLVPVPTVMQSEYLESMQRYRELSNVIPHGFDPQTWTNYIRQNPDLMDIPTPQQPERATASPMDHSALERFHRLLSEGSTPRDLPAMTPNESFGALSPAQSSTFAPPSRLSTPGGQRSLQQQQQQFQQQPQMQHMQSQQPRKQENGSHLDAIRPSSSASMQDSELPTQFSFAGRRGSVNSGYGSGDESTNNQPQKRAKLYRTEVPGRSDLNIEKQPSSLRVAASTAASVRLHRPTPVNPAAGIAQPSNEEPIRPPTPISGPNNLPRRARPAASLLRESVQTSSRYTSPYPMSDDQPSVDPNAHSPESRYQGLFEPSFSMPSSPPILFPNRSSPNLPPLATDPDSGFMSGGLDDLLDEDVGTPLEDCTTAVSNDATNNKHTVRPAIRGRSPASAPAVPESQNDCLIVSDGPAEQSSKESAPQLPRAPASLSGSRPSSRASNRQGPKPLAPAPMSQSELEHLLTAVPASDPVMPPQGPPQHSQSWPGPMSDFTTIDTPGPFLMSEDGKVRSGAGARRQRQIHARLDRCIRSGQAPPYCENCGAIETPTWRRAWSKELTGSEEDANECKKDSTMLFWKSQERDDEDKVTKFKIYKKSLVDDDKDFAQVLLCNPCGLWLHKFKSMRPEHKWNKANNANNANNTKRKRASRRTGPLSNGGASTRSRSKAQSTKPAESSPGATDVSSPAGDEEPTPHTDNDKGDNEAQELPSNKRRATSMEPHGLSDSGEGRWKDQVPMEALRRGIQSSPARNIQSRDVPAAADENSLTPKPVRRNLFPTAPNEGPLRALGDSVMNSPRRSPRIASQSDKRSQDKENLGPGAQSDLDCLFESPSFEFGIPASPTPKRRNPRANVLGEKRLALPYISPSKTRKDVDSEISPTKLTAQKLQRIQESPSRQNKTPKQTRPSAPDFSTLSEDATNADAFGRFDSMVMDVFEDDGTSAAPTDKSFLFDAKNSNWVDWMPSGHVSPMGSEEEQPNGECRTDGADEHDDLINLILSDPDFHNESVRNSQVNPFGDSNVLDSALFGSDFLDLGVKDNKGQGQANPENTS